MSNQKIKAKVGFLFFVSTGIQTNSPLVGIETKIPFASSSTEHKPLKDISIATNFLQGGGSRFPHKRYYVPAPNLALPDVNSTKTHAILTDFYDAGIMEISINTTLELDSVDTLIYLRQIFMADVPITCDQRSIQQVANDILSPLGLSVTDAQFSYIVEVNEYFGRTNLEEIFETDKNAIYGMMTGDEGYEFLSPDLADHRLNSFWASREFIRAVIFQNNFLLFNLNHIPRIKDYQDRQTYFGNKYHGGANEFFFMDADSAGVNHGILFSIEVGMVAKSISSSVLDRQISNVHLRRFRLGREIRRTKELRKDLILTLNRLDKVGISEMDELDNLIVVSLDVDPLVEKIKYLLELLESELDLLYQTSTNTLVNILTIVGLLLTILGLISPFFL